MQFNSQLTRGRIAESQIAQWLMSNEGWIVLPAYEIEIPSGKGPRLFSNNGELITPDMFTMKHQGKKFLNAWQEAKNKRSEEHTSELQSPDHLVCRLLLEKKKKKITI